MLYNLGITHIVNAASGPPHVNTGPRFYRDMSIDYYEVEADDSSEFVVSVFFYSTARFIQAALSKNGESSFRKREIPSTFLDGIERSDYTHQHQHV